MMLLHLHAQLDPSNRKNFIQRGAILLRRGLYSLAISDFSTVLASDPRNVECLFNRGENNNF